MIWKKSFKFFIKKNKKIFWMQKIKYNIKIKKLGKNQ
jgi:hypothetical protein